MAPLEWNRTLQKQAEAWSQECLFEHDNQTEAGENLFAAWGVEDLSDSYVMKEAVDSWYKEIQDYEYGFPELSSDNGHFTQIVWNGTTSVGCGTTNNCEGNMRIVVCRYYPPGNDPEAMEENVPLPLDLSILE